MKILFILLLVYSLGNAQDATIIIDKSLENNFLENISFFYDMVLTGIQESLKEENTQEESRIDAVKQYK